MTQHQELIFGEQRAELRRGLQRMRAVMTLAPGGKVVFSAPLVAAVGRPLVRALHRAEAQLLLRDADALDDPALVDRPDAERRGDAVLLILELMNNMEPGGSGTAA
ncbi:hypothetical protein ACE2AJ_14295 [Aquihabitans daechungensis]|uniref:hypothetical protein n=1 Tax=Aquihabitans daechungensis TaxID=1052257 RepID=UPI003BA1ABED